jgi:hypothetical protein
LKALHAARERDFIRRLDDEMDVVALKADLDDAKIIAPLHDLQRFSDRVISVRLSQTADVLRDAQDAVDRITSGESRPFLVALARSLALLRPSRAGPLAAAQLSVLVAEPDRLLDVSFASSAAHAHVVSPGSFERN